MTKNKIIVAITGASGSIYAQLLLKTLETLSTQIDDIAVVFSETAKSVWKHELGTNAEDVIPFKIYQPDDFWAPFASGSAGYKTMIICPCSMGTLGRIASGVSDDLITRAADVILKERRKLILITRETPLSLIHINNLKTITEAGGIVCPASPSFYSKPQSIENLCMSVVERVLQLAGLEGNFYKWQE